MGDIVSLFVTGSLYLSNLSFCLGGSYSGVVGIRDDGSSMTLAEHERPGHFDMDPAGMDSAGWGSCLLQSSGKMNSWFEETEILHHAIIRYYASSSGGRHFTKIQIFITFLWIIWN